jgi:hypothetical protein
MAQEEPDLVNEVRATLLPALREYGFQLRQLSSVSDAVGDCVLELASPNAVLTVTRDRGQVFVDVASAERPTQKYWLGELVAFLEGERDPRVITNLLGAVAVLQAAHQRLLSPELLVGRSSELVAYRQEFNKRRWGPYGTSPPGAS